MSNVNNKSVTNVYVIENRRTSIEDKHQMTKNGYHLEFSVVVIGGFSFMF